MTTTHRVHNSGSPGRTTAPLVLYKSVTVLLANTQLEGSPNGCIWTLDWWVLSCWQDQSSAVSRGLRAKRKSLRLYIALAKGCLPWKPLVQLTGPIPHNRGTLRSHQKSQPGSASLQLFSQLWLQSLGSFRSCWADLVITRNCFHLSVMPVSLLASGHPSWCQSSFYGCSPILEEGLNGNLQYKAER